MIYVRDIQMSKELKNMGLKLVAGENGLSRPVYRAAVAETMDFISWQKGNEFLEFSGFGMELNKIENMLYVIQRAYDHNIAALAFQLSDEFINEIPTEAIELADRLGLPVFTLPYEISFSQSLHPISELIVKTEMRETMVIDLIKNVLLATVNEDFFQEKTREYGFDFSDKYQIIEIMPAGNSAAGNKLLHKIAYAYTRKEIPQKTIAFSLDGKILILSPQSDGEHVIAGLSDDEIIAAGVGSVYPVNGWKKSLREADIALNTSKLTHQKYVVFERLGFIRLIAESSSDEDIRTYIYDILGPLLDLENGTAPLLETLETYVDCNYNIAQAARKLYVHRNTLIQRITKITEISGIDFNDPSARRELANALYLNKIFNG